MKIEINDISINVLIDESKLDQNKIPVLFLHGFTGSAHDWDFIFDKLTDEFLPFAIDLVGHGNSSSPSEQNKYYTESIIQIIDGVINHLGFEKIIICGYSMGGRAALSYACNYPKKILALILESSTAGLQNKRERDKRVRNDNILSLIITEKGIDYFIDYWMNLPLFNTLSKLPNDKFEQIVKRKLRNNKIGLANFLKGFGTGITPSYWNQLNLIKSPVLLVSGNLDDKFTNINYQMKELFPDVKYERVDKCGHVVHLEKPEEFIILINDFLQELDKNF